MMRHLMLAAAGVLALGSALADSPVADAIQKGRRDVALDLIAKGADVNAAQADGSTPLHWAAYKLDHGARAETARSWRQDGCHE